MLNNCTSAGFGDGEGNESTSLPFSFFFFPEAFPNLHIAYHAFPSHGSPSHFARVDKTIGFKKNVF